MLGQRGGSSARCSHACNPLRRRPFRTCAGRRSGISLRGSTTSGRSSVVGSGDLGSETHDGSAASRLGVRL